MFTQMLSWSLEGIKVLNMVNRIKQTQGSLSSWKHQPHSLHSSCLLKALWPPKNNTSLIPPFFPSLQKSWHKGSQSCHGRRKTFQALSSVLWDAHFHLYVFRMGSIHCGLTIHPKNNTPVEAGRAVYGDLYLSKQPSYYPFISFSPLKDNLHSGGNSMQ